MHRRGGLTAHQNFGLFGSGGGLCRTAQNLHPIGGVPLVVGVFSVEAVHVQCQIGWHPLWKMFATLLTLHMTLFGLFGFELSASHCVFVQQNTEELSEPIVEWKLSQCGQNWSYWDGTLSSVAEQRLHGTVVSNVKMSFLHAARMN